VTYPNDARSDLITGDERNAILAGLRLLQRQYTHLPGDICMQLTGGAQTAPISEGDINQLCEEINTALKIVLFTE